MVEGEILFLLRADRGDRLFIGFHGFASGITIFHHGFANGITVSTRRDFVGETDEIILSSFSLYSSFIGICSLYYSRSLIHGTLSRFFLSFPLFLSF